MSACPCDQAPVLGPAPIPAGLGWLPRRPATFAQFRRALLSSVGTDPVLRGWRAREGDDLGLMLIEMWAYVGDALAFYDEVIAQEAYLGTARLRPSLRRLVGLLGYQPRPAVAARVDVALVADGRLPVEVGPGLPLRSAAFGAEPPQVFETVAAATVHPFLNRWQVEPPVAGTVGQWIAVGGSLSTLVVSTVDGVPRRGPVLVRPEGRPWLVQARTITALGDAGRRRTEVTFDAPLGLPGDLPLAAVGLLRPTQEAGLWKLAPAGSASSVPAAVADLAGPATWLLLDGLHRRLRPGDPLVVSRRGQHRWFTADAVAEVPVEVSPPATVGTGNAAVAVPGVSVPATRIRLDAGLNAPGRRLAGDADWTLAEAAEAVVSYGFLAAGKAAAPPASHLGPADALTLAAPVEVPAGRPPDRLLLADADSRATLVRAAVDLPSRTVAAAPATSWSPPFRLPVSVYGNVVEATRGQTVPGETLGSGDGAVAGQSFRLAKRPLTYLPVPGGVRSTLEVRVEGVLWSEVPSFFGAGPGDQVYVVRPDDGGASVVRFGDGVRGARLPSGTDNVVATYRFGAGAAAPPAGAVTQLARPVMGLASVVNPVGAAGGADAEGPDGIRRFAPGSALVLGRAVSLADMAAVASGVAGVRAVEVAWRWHPARQGPAVQVRYVGEEGVQPTVARALRGMADPSTAFDVERATAVPAVLSLDVAIDPRRAELYVRRALRLALIRADSGLLAPERIGIGTPLYRSRLFDAVLAVEGTLAVRGLSWDGAPFVAFALHPGAGRYFDLEAGALVLNGKATDD